MMILMLVNPLKTYLPHMTRGPRRNDQPETPPPLYGNIPVIYKKNQCSTYLNKQVLSL